MENALYLLAYYLYIDIEKLMEQYGLTANQVDMKCSKTHLVAKYIGEWGDIAKSLNLTDPEIIAIRRDGFDEGERRNMMLSRWITKNGRDATFRVLLEACVEVDQGDVAGKILAFGLKAGGGGGGGGEVLLNKRWSHIEVQLY